MSTLPDPLVRTGAPYHGELRVMALGEDGYDVKRRRAVALRTIQLSRRARSGQGQAVLAVLAVLGLREAAQSCARLRAAPRGAR